MASAPSAHERRTLTVARGDGSSKLFLGLQLGRAIAVVTVVLTHAVAHPFPGAPGVSHLLGRYGVTLFFVISGYIMVATTGTGSFNPRAFMTRRLLRIVPLYYLASFVLLAGRIAAPNLFKEAQFEPLFFLKSLAFIPAYQLNGSGLIFPFFRLGWTLNYEIFFYLCFALMAGLGLHMRLWAITLVFAALVGLGALLPLQDAIAIFYTRVDVLGFVAGMWLGARAIDPPVHSRPVPVWPLLVLSLVIIAYLAYFYQSIRADIHTQLLTIAACAVHIRLLVALIDDRGRGLAQPLLLLGNASYSIYLFHMFGVGVSVALSKKLGGIFVYLFMPVSLIAGIGVGLIVYWLIERPIGRWLRDLRIRARRPPGVAIS